MKSSLIKNQTPPTSLTYRGQVIIKTYDKKSKRIVETKVINNHGTLSLFKFLCDCLVGVKNYESNKRPRYLDASSEILTSTDAAGIMAFNSCLYYKSILNNSKVLSEDKYIKNSDNIVFNVTNYYCNFSTTILKGQVDNTQGGAIRSLVLSNSPSSEDNSDILAWINLGEDNKIEIGDNQTILVEWNLSFNNYIENKVEEYSL